ncbi:hypothetical protein HY388_01210 [Candidatus Daviesbacteria bacterium]|nr:hypothetical protein [Candidatus Daviesbacteria bacterium]
MAKVIQTVLILSILTIILSVVLSPATVSATPMALFTLTKEDNLTPQVLGGATQSGQTTTSSALPDAGSLAPTLILAGLGGLLTTVGFWRLRKSS